MSLLAWRLIRAETEGDDGFIVLKAAVPHDRSEWTRTHTSLPFLQFSGCAHATPDAFGERFRRLKPLLPCDMVVTLESPAQTVRDQLQSWAETQDG